jgi:hypothetical protein
VLEGCTPVGHHCGGCLSRRRSWCRCAGTWHLGGQAAWGWPKSRS